jgi:hypothetical protein
MDLFLPSCPKRLFDELWQLNPFDNQHWNERRWLDPGKLYFIEVLCPSHLRLVAKQFTRRQVIKIIEEQ